MCTYLKFHLFQIMKTFVFLILLYFTHIFSDYLFYCPELHVTKLGSLKL